MSHKIVTSAAAVLAGTLALSGVWSLGHATGAGAVDTTRPAAPSLPQTLRFFIQDAAQATVDLPPVGESQGDVFAYHGVAYDHKGGKAIGRFGGTCTTLPKAPGVPADQTCFLDAILPGGQLYFEVIDSSKHLFSGKKVDVGIIGGTGRYRGARGDGTIAVPADVENQTDAYMVFHVID